MEDSKMNFKRFGSLLRLIIFTVILIIVSLICFCECEKSNKNADNMTEVEDEKPQASPRTYNLQFKMKDEQSKIKEEDEYLLAKIAMAEAEGESIEGKALVMLVVLNRVEDDRFPNTVYDVIYQPYQFSPVTAGTFEYIEPNEECYEALELIKSGWDESDGALYFESCQGNPWEGTEIAFVFSEGGHEFYK